MFAQTAHGCEIKPETQKLLNEITIAQHQFWIFRTFAYGKIDLEYYEPLVQDIVKKLSKNEIHRILNQLDKPEEQTVNIIEEHFGHSGNK